MGVGHLPGLNGHGGVVQHHGDDRDIAADGGLKVQPDHAEGGVAHEVDAYLLGSGQLGADGQTQPGAQTVGLAPAQVGPGAVGPVERDNLVAGAARVMGHDSVFRRDGVHEVPDYPVGCHGDLRGREFGPPLAEPAFPLGLHLFGGRLVVLAAVAYDLLAGFDHLAQDQLGVAHDGKVDVVVLVDVGGVVGGLDQRLSRGKVHRHAVLGPTGPNSEQEVGAAEEMICVSRHCCAGAAQGQGMDLWEGALAQQGAANGHLEQLSQLHQFIGSLAVQHTLTGHDHRVLGGAQGLGGRLDVGGVALTWNRPAGHVVERLLADIFQSYIGGDLNRHGTAPALAQAGEGPTHDI